MKNEDQRRPMDLWLEKNLEFRLFYVEHGAPNINLSIRQQLETHL